MEYDKPGKWRIGIWGIPGGKAETTQEIWWYVHRWLGNRKLGREHENDPEECGEGLHGGNGENGGPHRSNG